jgi:[ribosomal protein S5]-alanine N-acetyltransferase
MLELESRRLRLVAATAESVRADILRSPRFAELLCASIPLDWPPETLSDALPLFLKWHEENPDWVGWLAWYAIRLDAAAPVLCGSAGFKGPPDEDGMVEIGYSMMPAHQRCGFAKEMVETLVQWAFAQPGVRCVEAETTVDNIGSVRVLERTGFCLIDNDYATGSLRYRCPGA